MLESFWLHVDLSLPPSWELWGVHWSPWGVHGSRFRQPLGLNGPKARQSATRKPCRSQI